MKGMNMCSLLLNGTQTRSFHAASSLFGRYQPFSANLDPEELEEAREWASKFNDSAIPKGNTIFSRSSGPGGQHVNKTESKAITTWPIHDLAAIVPRLLRPQLRASKYYTQASDSLSFAAQTARQRSMNVDENRVKLLEELMRIYKANVPGEEDADKAEKHKQIEKSFHEKRLRSKGIRAKTKQNRNKQYDF